MTINNNEILMKSWILTLLILFFIGQHSIAQNDNAEFEKRMLMKTHTENYNWVYRNVFIDYKIGALNELFIPQTKSYFYGKYDYSSATIPSDTMTFVDAGYMISIFNYSLEPRINLLNRRHFSLMMKSPLSIGLSVFSEPKKGNLLKKSGYFNINIPILVGISSGLNSNFTNSTKRGFALSAGYQFMLAPLVGGKAEFTSFYNVKPLDEAYKQRKLWGMPLVQIDYYRLKKNSKIRGYSFAFSPSKNFYLKLAVNYALTKK